MSFSPTNIMNRKSPQIAGYEFDAILEDEFALSVEIPSYPIESGASISDHRIINPARYTLRGVISNKPLKVSVFDFAGGLVSNLTDNPIVAAGAGMSAGALAGFLGNDGGEGTRVSAAVQTLIDILEGKEPFDVDTGDIQLKNMVVTSFSRKRDPENENAMIFELELQEFVTLDRLTQEGQPSHKQMKNGSVEQSANSKQASMGKVQTKTPSASQTNATAGVLV